MEWVLDDREGQPTRWIAEVEGGRLVIIADRRDGYSIEVQRITGSFSAGADLALAQERAIALYEQGG
jgi:hypothetical protein